MKSLEFSKPTLAITLAIALAWLLSVRPLLALGPHGYIVTLRQVGPDVVATGSGSIDLTGLTFFTFFQSTSLSPAIRAATAPFGNRTLSAFINTGPISSSVDSYVGASGPARFGSSVTASASSGSGDMVGINVGGTDFEGFPLGNVLSVPRGYVSGTALSDVATYSGKTFATLGVRPGTYVWKWGWGANQSFTLQIEGIEPAHIANISTRARVIPSVPESVPIAGFILTGTDSKQVVVRGLGPTLTQFGVRFALADPFLSLVDGAGNVLQTNDNWRDTQQAEIQATGLAPPNDLESAILRTLQPGNYTAILSGKNGIGGEGLVEVYDISTGALAELTNVSTRGHVGGTGLGKHVMIGGFITNGSTQVVVRGLGPTLTQFGVSGALADPQVTLFDGNGNIVQSNNDWKNTQQAEIQATGLAPPDDAEAAILATVAAGQYTVVLDTAEFGLGGIGLVEVYKQ